MLDLPAAPDHATRRAAHDHTPAQCPAHADPGVIVTIRVVRREKEEDQIWSLTLQAIRDYGRRLGDRTVQVGLDGNRRCPPHHGSKPDDRAA
jgi:hypothetical protein